MKRKKKSNLNLNRQKKRRLKVVHINDIMNELCKPISPQFRQKIVSSVKRSFPRSPSTRTFTPTKSPCRKRIRQLLYDKEPAQKSSTRRHVHFKDDPDQQRVRATFEDAYGDLGVQLLDAVDDDDAVKASSTKPDPSADNTKIGCDALILHQITPDDDINGSLDNISYSGCDDLIGQPALNGDASVSCSHDMQTSLGRKESLQDRSLQSSIQQADTHSSNEKILSEMVDLIPTVLHALEKEGKQDVFLKLFRQVDEGGKPFDNIAFRLWAEVVDWFSLENTCSMRYSDSTKKFWKLGWQTFGGKFLRFMSGYKNEAQLVSGEAEKGHFNPILSDINFAVPDITTLRSYKPYELFDIQHGTRRPGIYKDVISSLSLQLKNRALCLTFDGKKIKQGLTKISGDIDLLGFENGVTLKEKQTQFALEVQSYDDVLQAISKTDEVEGEQRVDILSRLHTAHKKISQSLIGMRLIKEKKEYAQEKFKERGGKDWRNGKFVFVISAIEAYIYEINNFITKSIILRDDICNHIVSLNNSEATYVTARSIDLESHPDYNPILVNDSTDSRKVRQRSPKWHAIRKKAMVTGSTFFKALGFEGLKKQREHFQNVICGVPLPDPSEEAQKNMKYGSDNEINAVTTVVGKILPVYAPELEYHEEGCVVFDYNQATFLVVSPDGSLRDKTSGETKMALEIKCPVYKVHTAFPARYYLQCVSEIEALGVETLLYVSWRPEISTVFLVNRDLEMFTEALDLAKCLLVDKAKQPTKVDLRVKEMKTKIHQKASEIKLIGEFESLATSDSSDSMNALQEQRKHPEASLIDLFENLKEVSKDEYELKREKASEALVFLVCDLDRTWSKERLLWAPVCWCAKGYSLNTSTMRTLMENVLDECFKSGLYVPACSFDGQWHNIVARDVNDKPLSLFQLQKDLWKRVQRIPKSEIEKHIKAIENRPAWYWEDHFTMEYLGEHKRIITCTNGGVLLPKTPSKGWNETKKMKKIENEHDDNLVEPGNNILEAICDEVLESVAEMEDNLEVLATNNDRMIVEELATTNVDGNEWTISLNQILSDVESATKPMSSEVESDVTDAEILPLYTSFNEHLQVSLENTETTLEENTSQVGGNQQIQQQTQLTEEQIESLLAMLKSDSNANKNGKWDNRHSTDVIKCLSSVTDLNKLLDSDVRVVVRLLKKIRGKDVQVKENDRKKTKLQEIVRLLNIEESNCASDDLHDEKVQKRGKGKRQVKPLKSLAIQALKTVPKAVLNIAYAELLWPVERERWFNNSRISKKLNIKDMETPEFWIYSPEFSLSRNQLEVRCIDSTHLLTRTRRKTCKGGIEGLDNSPWMKVAKQGKTLLTPIMVSEIVDPMSMPMARTHFGPPVQAAMRENGDYHAASLCEAVYDWWRAEDEPGISAHERMRLRFKLRERLLHSYDFASFPPPGMYVQGWPAQLWEALICNIDAKALLYALTETYNTRAFSSMMGETFFAELTNQDRGSHGTVSCDDFALYIGRTVEKMQAKLDPNRSFTYRTSSKKVYPLVGNVEAEETMSAKRPVTGQTLINEILLRDHQFDTSTRKRAMGKGKFGTVSLERNAVLKGSLGVRWERARVNEAKMLPMDRMGLSDRF